MILETHSAAKIDSEGSQHSKAHKDNNNIKGYEYEYEINLFKHL